MSTEQPIAPAPDSHTAPPTHPDATPAALFADAAFHHHPYPRLARLREAAPVCAITMPDGARAWLITRYDEALQVLKDARVTNEPPGGMHPGAMHSGTLERLMSPNMIFMDKADHRRLRGLLAKAFTPRFAEGLRPAVQQLADELLDAVAARGRMEFISDFAFPLPITVIADMLGLPQEDHQRLRDWSAVLFDSIGAHDGADREQQANEFAGYVKELIAHKRREPADDLISKLVQAEQDGERLDEQELRAMIVLLIFAGHETTVNLLGNGLLALFRQPEQLEALKRDPSLVPNAVEEMLRFCGPATMLAPRYAREDMQIGGVTIAKDELILLSVAGADRDPAAFSDPESIDLRRPTPQHLAFGQGMHICIGAPLARMEAQVAFTTLLKRFPELRLTVPVDEVVWRGNFALRGVEALPLAF
ncbi:cytochrome P450 family protein [Haliangium ochraceum]|uniref:Cytochrome P450 n=1 Tax=Haliangium ochraceum (strain DSM 14365 / JCM 11303 / SMP-2) TaxID=502025 RepID=D0LKK1_HALO1|nr:cytochrome P450 [Haliangium ochraceum]ACY15049.1 cytochrome P450 [Haliangium ochraceum DSM 14365]